MARTDNLQSSTTAETTDVCRLFDESANLHPTSIAVSDGGRLYDYSQLRDEVEKVMSALLELGCQPRTRVILALSHGVELVASVLAVLKLGATYVPVDTRAPLDRVRRMVENSGASMMLYSRPHAELAAELGIVALCVSGLDAAARDVRSRAASAGDLAYILYTSGSTGVPKGVGITHRNLLNYVLWARDRYIKSPGDRIALYTTLAFDFTLTCIFPPLIAGASIGIYDGIADPMVIRRIIDDRSVNIIKITPSYLSVLCQLSSGRRHIDRLIVGGEDLTTALAAKVRAKLGPVEIINEYGPTEATVGCVFHAFDPGRDTGESVPIGVPIPGMRLYVVDGEGALVGDGGPGELCLSGRSVADGYLQGSEAARAAFVPNPFEPGTTMYRTGDIVRRNDDGDLVFVGRIDDQVKIRGNRVELGEVTGALLSLPKVTSAYVTSVRDYGSQALAAVVTGQDGLDEDEILARLAQTLPPYMVPTTLRVVAELPMTPNQKIDRDAVLAMVGKRGG